jgi:hypothetical protein
MLTITFTALFASMAVPPASGVLTQAADATQDVTANAALKYWQAFAQLPLEKDLQKVQESAAKASPEAVQNLIQKGRASLLYLRRGAKLPRCDWSLDYEDGIVLLMPHLSKARSLASLANWQVRYDAEHGHQQDAMDNAVAMLTLARHVNSDPILISNGVRYSIEWMAIGALAPHLQKFDAAALKVLSASLEKLPPGATLQQGLLWEKRHITQSITKLLRDQERANKGDWQATLKAIFNLAESQDAIPAISSIDKAVQLANDLAPFYDEQARLVTLAKTEYDAKYPEFIKKAKAANPLSGALLPAVDRLLANEWRSQAHMALFKAAIAVVQGGPDQLKEFKDPFGQGPIEYRPLDKGFELKSKLVIRGQQVAIVVGRSMEE